MNKIQSLLKEPFFFMILNSIYCTLVSGTLVAKSEGELDLTVFNQDVSVDAELTE